jgi:3-oxoacyl-[acyl-carrier protein] reductase
MIKETTLITGSTSGIGKQIGMTCLMKGHKVIFTGRDKKKCKKLYNEVSKDYSQFEILHNIDLSVVTNITTLYDFLILNNLEVDNLILNVGATCRKPLEEISMKEWNDVMNMNLTHPFFLIQKLLPLIKKRIIFIGSVTGHVANSVSIPYGVSKGSLEILTKYLARDLGKRKITVNTVAPGFIATKWHVDKSKEQIDRIKKQITMRRLGTKEEVAKACQFIIENDYVNGQTICVDGGFHLE